MKITILDDYQDAVRHLECFSKLNAHEVTVFNDSVTSLDVLAKRIGNAEALVLIRERTRINEELLKRLPKLRIISQTGKIARHLDLPACTEHGVAVAEGKGAPYAPAELTWGLVLAAMRHIPQETARLKSGGWQSTLGTVVRGRTLGIYGYGKIGALVAGYGRAFNMKVWAWGREGTRKRAATDGIDLAPSKEALFAESDVLSLHLRLNDDTAGIVTRADLAQMKPTALLVNTSRAELIEKDALVEALSAGRPGLAAVDVFEEEPILNGEHPLLKMNNVVCTPHLGYVEKDNYELYLGDAFDNILNFAAGKPTHIANQDVLVNATSRKKI